MTLHAHVSTVCVTLWDAVPLFRSVRNCPSWHGSLSKNSRRFSRDCRHSHPVLEMWRPCRASCSIIVSTSDENQHLSAAPQVNITALPVPTI